METDPDLPLAVLGLFVGALTWMVAGLQTWFTRPRAPRGGQPTMDLLDEPPPAIVDLVTDDFEVTPESVPATLCDLAARRWLSIEEAGFANVVIRLGRGDGHGSLLPYEQQVLDHMHALAVGGVVPAKAMTTGPVSIRSRTCAAKAPNRLMLSCCRSGAKLRPIRPPASITPGPEAWASA